MNTLALRQSQGCSREKAIGKNIVEFGFFSEKIIRIFRENLEKRMMGIDVKPYKVKVIAKDGKTINLEVRTKKLIMLDSLRTLLYSALLLRESAMKDDSRNMLGN